MEYDNNMKGSAWNKTSAKGTEYISGSITIDNQEYWISIFTNTQKKSEKSPDFSITLKEKESVIRNPHLAPQKITTVNIQPSGELLDDIPF